MYAYSMPGKLTFRYDKIGDILYVDLCPPYPEQESTELDGMVAARTNPTTGNVENLEILFFTKRLASDPTLELPLSATLRLTE